MHPRAHIAREVKHQAIQFRLVIQGQLKVILIRVNDQLRSWSLKLRHNLHKLLHLDWQSLIVMIIEPTQHGAPNRALRSNRPTSAATLIPMGSAQHGRASLLLTRFRGLQNPCGFPKPHDEGMGTKGKIKDRGAAVAQSANQQQGGRPAHDFTAEDARSSSSVTSWR